MNKTHGLFEHIDYNHDFKVNDIVALSDSYEKVERNGEWISFDIDKKEKNND